MTSKLIETPQKKWRDEVSAILVGSVSTSSARFQDNLFEYNALPPSLISKLGIENRRTKGSIEKYIYKRLRERFTELNAIIKYATQTPLNKFYLEHFLNTFTKSKGLRRSIDKVYEVVVYSLFETLISVMEIDINISIKNLQNPIMHEFEGFSKKIFGADFPNFSDTRPAKFFRLGVANAADRGLDMWGNFGLAIQIKHLTISEEVAESIVGDITADRIVIVCKTAEEKIIRSIVAQLGWKGRIQSIITLDELAEWYDKAMRGDAADLLGQQVLDTLIDQLQREFPLISKSTEVENFLAHRGYNT